MKTQNTTAPTPGPWHVEGFNPPMIYARNGLDIIAQCDSAGEMLDEQEQANAQLIASAPELLAAVEWLSKSMAEYQQAILAGNEITLGMAMRADGGLDAARAAISKAMGGAK